MPTLIMILAFLYAYGHGFHVGAATSRHARTWSDYRYALVMALLWPLWSAFDWWLGVGLERRRREDEQAEAAKENQ